MDPLDELVALIEMAHDAAVRIRYAYTAGPVYRLLLEASGSTGERFKAMIADAAMVAGTLAYAMRTEGDASERDCAFVDELSERLVVLDEVVTVNTVKAAS